MTDEEATRVAKYLAEGWAPARDVVAGLLMRRDMGNAEMRRRADVTLMHLFDVHCAGPELAAHFELSCGGSISLLVQDAMESTGMPL